MSDVLSVSVGIVSDRHDIQATTWVTDDLTAAADIAAFLRDRIGEPYAETLTDGKGAREIARAAHQASVTMFGEGES